MTGMKGTSLSQKFDEVLTMIGPGFAVGSNFSLNLSFKDMDEIKAHPMASQMLINFDQFLQMVMGKDLKHIREWKVDYNHEMKEDFNMEDFQKHVDNSEYCKNKMWLEQVLTLMSEFLADFDPNCHVTLRQNLHDIASSEVVFKGFHYGQLIEVILKAVTLKMRKEDASLIQQDFVNTDYYEKHKDVVQYYDPMGNPVYPEKYVPK